MSVLAPPRYIHPSPALQVKTDHLDKTESGTLSLREGAFLPTMTDPGVFKAGDRPQSLPDRPPLPPPPGLWVSSQAPPPPPPPLAFNGLGAQSHTTPYGLGQVHNFPPLNPAYGNFFTSNTQSNQFFAANDQVNRPTAWSGQSNYTQYPNTNQSFYGFSPPQAHSPFSFQEAQVAFDNLARTRTARSTAQHQAVASTGPSDTTTNTKRKILVDGRWQRNPLHAVRSTAQAPTRIEKSQPKPKTPQLQIKAKFLTASKQKGIALVGPSPAYCSIEELEADILSQLQFKGFPFQSLIPKESSITKKAFKAATATEIGQGLLSTGKTTIVPTNAPLVPGPQGRLVMADTLNLQALNLGKPFEGGLEVNNGSTNSARPKSPPRIMLPAPTPTQEYMNTAATEPFVIDPPHRMLVVLDLNGTLLYRPDSRKSARFIARPFLKSFLEYLFEHFSVMVWSSAKPKNVKAMVDKVFDGEQRAQLSAVWARETLDLTPWQYNAKVQVYKKLDKIWADHQIQNNDPKLPEDQVFNQHNTILIDDSALKAAAQPFNLLEIPEFTGTPAQKTSDILRQVAGYLHVARMQENVSSFMRKVPFEADGTWQYDWPEEEAEAGKVIE